MTETENETETETDRTDKRTSFVTGVLLLLFSSVLAGICAWLGFIRYSPPAPNPSTVPQDTFSAARAEVILKMLVGDGIPHPSGSKQNAIVRDRIVDYLKRLGVEIELHETSNLYRLTGESIPLVNIIAKVPGTNSSATIALSAHYDTKFSTPGASDDGVGVATVLEIARYFSNHRPTNDLVFLITDGEEMGLLGAEKFIAEHPLAKDIDVIINLEARGTSGPSLMFETGTASLASIRRFAATAKRPFTSSLFYEIYKLLPNDTDFTRFREGGLQGFNFAFIGDVKNYHTTLDNFATVDRGSMQHHGDNAFELMKLLAHEAPLAFESGRSVYFDVMGYRVFYWPEPWAVPMALTACLLLVGAVIWQLRRNKFRFTQLLFSLAAVFGFLLCGIALGLFLDFGMKLDGQFENPWPYVPLPRILAFWFSAAALAGVFRRVVEGDPRQIFFAVWFSWTVLLLLSSLFAAGASYLFLIPCTFAVVGVSVAVGWSTRSIAKQRTAMIFAAVLGWIGVCIVWLPMEPLYYDALGFRLNLFLIARVTLVCSALLPVIACLKNKSCYLFSSVAGISAVVCLLIGGFGP